MGPLGQNPTVWAECLFVDPVGDIAVLGSVDSQEFYGQHGLYNDFIDDVETLELSDIQPRFVVSAKLLSLKNEWFACNVQHTSGPLWIADAKAEIVGGMSGSPIIDDGAKAIGVLCCSGSINGELSVSGGPNPRLAYNLPRWIDFGADKPYAL